MYNKKQMKARRRQLRREQTPAERVLWGCLRNRKLLGVKFRRQYSVDYYIIDFYAPELKLAVEADGGIHERRDQQEYDKERENYLKACGITILRIPNEIILTSTHQALDLIEETIQDLRSSQ